MVECEAITPDLINDCSGSGSGSRIVRHCPHNMTDLVLSYAKETVSSLEHDVRYYYPFQWCSDLNARGQQLIQQLSIRPIAATTENSQCAPLSPSVSLLSLSESILILHVGQPCCDIGESKCLVVRKR